VHSLKVIQIQRDILEVDGHWAFMILPVGAENSELPIPWIWYAPTFASGLPGSEENWMIQEFLKVGIAVAGVDIGESQGNVEGRKVYSAFYYELVSKHHFAARPALLARSRGGLMLYNWAAENPDKLSGIGGIYPVCNLLDYPGIEIAAKAYNISSDELNKTLSAHNPIARVKPLAQAGIPILHIHGDNDVAVPIKTNSEAMARQYKKFGGKMTVLIQKGHGHDLWTGYFHNKKLVYFLIKQAKKGSGQLNNNIS
jgi:pimeloyl-ACP methyl ester carboxylesterase